MKSVLKAPAVMLTALALASVSVGQEQIVGAVIGGLFTNVASDFVVPLAETVKNLLFRKHPNELDENLRRAIAESIKRTLKTLLALYESTDYDHTSKRYLKDFTDDLISSSSRLLVESSTIGITRSELEVYIYPNRTENSYNDLIDRLLEHCNTNNIDKNFLIFFKKNFLDQMQSSILQVLNEEGFESANNSLKFIIQDEIKTGLKEIIKNQSNIESKIDKLENWQLTAHVGKISNTQLRQLAKLLSDVNNSQKINIVFKTVIDKKLEKIQHNLHSINSSTKYIQYDVYQIRKLLPTYLTTAITVFSLSTTLLLFAWFQNIQRPFSVSLKLAVDTTLSISQLYPKLKRAKSIRLLFQDGKEKSSIIDDQNTAMFLDLERKYLKTKTQIVIEDDVWQSSVDSFELQLGQIEIPIRPTKKLARISGTVLAIDSKNEIVNIEKAYIHIGNDTSLISDRKGNFNATLPVHMLRERYELKASAPNYESQNEYYYPQSTPFKFILKPKNR